MMDPISLGLLKQKLCVRLSVFQQTFLDMSNQV